MQTNCYYLDYIIYWLSSRFLSFFWLSFNFILWSGGIAKSIILIRVRVDQDWWHSPKLQRCWNLTIRLFSIISKTHVGGSYLSVEKVGVFYFPSRRCKTLFTAFIRWDWVYLLKFPFLSHAEVFSREILLVCRLKYTYTCFPFHFYF